MGRRVRIALTIVGVLLGLLTIVVTVSVWGRTGVHLGTASASTQKSGSAPASKPASAQPSATPSPKTPASTPASAPASQQGVPDGGAAPTVDCNKLGAPRVTKDDFELRDPTNCSTLWASQTARAAQGVLMRSYDIKVLSFGSTEEYNCAHGGAKAVITGASAMLGFCEASHAYLVTQPGVAAKVPSTKAVFVWYALGITSATSRFTTDTALQCAAGYIIDRRPGGNPTADIEDVKTLKVDGWTPKDPAWQYMVAGINLAQFARSIDDCDTAKPAAALATAP